MFTEFNFSLLTEFSDYSKKPNAIIEEDGTGFSTVPIYATPEELNYYSEAIGKILQPAMSMNKNCIALLS